MRALSSRQREALAVLALVLCWALFIWPFFAPNPADRGSLPAGDVDSQYYVLARLMAKRLGEGELPLWNPYSFGGTPFLAEPQAAALYPPRWLTLFLGSLLAGRGHLPFLLFELELFAHLALAALLTYLFARRLTGSRPASLVGALTFSFSSFMTGYPLLQPSILEASAWLPGVLLGIEWGIARRRRGWWLATGLLALSFLAGSTQMTLYIGYAALLYLLFRGRQRGWRWSALLRAALLWLVTAALLSLAQAWPTLELTLLSPRASSDFETVSNGLRPQELFELFVPTLTTYYATLYVGLPSLALAFTARRHPTVPFWMGLALVALFLSFGRNSPVYGWAYLLLPGFGLFRSQERIVLLWSFALAMLAALGTARLLASDGPPHELVPGSARRGWLLLLLLLGVGSGAALLLDHPALPRLVFATLLAGGIVALLTGYRRGVGRQRLFLALVVLLVLDLFTINGRTVWSEEPPEQHEVLPPLVAPLLGEEQVGLLDADIGVHDNIGVQLEIPTAVGASQLRLARYEQAINRLKRLEWWYMWGVSHVATWRPALPIPAQELYRKEEGEELHVLYRLTEPTARARLLFAAEVVPDIEALWERLAAPEHHPARHVLLEQPLPQPLEGGTGTVRALRIEEERWEISTESSTTALLWLSLPYYPGWQATVDGQPVPLIRADGLWTALLVPPGTHTVHVTFVPRGWAVAALLSLAAWILWAVGGLILARRKAPLP